MLVPFPCPLPSVSSLRVDFTAMVSRSHHSSRDRRSPSEHSRYALLTPLAFERLAYFFLVPLSPVLYCCCSPFPLLKRVVLAVEAFPAGRSIAVARRDGCWRRICRQRRRFVELDHSRSLRGASARTLSGSGEIETCGIGEPYLEHGKLGDR